MKKTDKHYKETAELYGRLSFLAVDCKEDVAVDTLKHKRIKGEGLRFFSTVSRTIDYCKALVDGSDYINPNFQSPLQYIEATIANLEKNISSAEEALELMRNFESEWTPLYDRYHQLTMPKK